MTAVRDRRAPIAKLEIWGRASSSNVQALMWLVGELDLTYIRHDVGGRFGGTDTDAFGALNPNRTVPVLRDEDMPPLWETGAILRYLAARYAGDPFWPADPRARAEVDRWAEWAKINVAMGFTMPIFWRVVRTPPAKRDPVAIAGALKNLHGHLAIAEARIGEMGWLAGSEFTLADIQFGHVLHRYFDIEIERPNWPGLETYFTGLMERPAYRDHVAIDYGELRAS